MSDTQGDFVPTPLAEIFEPRDATANEPGGGQPDPVVTQEASTETGDAPPVEQPARNEKGQFAKPTAPAVAPTAEEPQHVPLAALKAEREKRQALERELEAARARPADQPKPIPNPAEDPQGYHAAIREELLIQRVEMSEALVRSQFQDVDEKFATFRKHSASNPVLVQQVLADPNPWLRMYREAEKMAALDEIGPDPKAYRDRLKAEILAELKGQQQIESKPSHPTPLPTSLASVRSAGSRTQPAGFTGPTPLDEIVRFKG